MTIYMILGFHLLVWVSLDLGLPLDLLLFLAAGVFCNSKDDSQLSLKYSKNHHIPKIKGKSPSMSGWTTPMLDLPNLRTEQEDIGLKIGAVLKISWYSEITFDFEHFTHQWIFNHNSLENAPYTQFHCLKVPNTVIDSKQSKSSVSYDVTLPWPKLKVAHNFLPYNIHISHRRQCH